ncbi:hypothetical protein [Nocardioides convexus]|uniref:hypothetical protein n=1 Tax=Nocardioides convexus TaxID=2712224 RepID=UPI003100CA46
MARGRAGGPGGGWRAVGTTPAGPGGSRPRSSGVPRAAGPVGAGRLRDRGRLRPAPDLVCAGRRAAAGRGLRRRVRAGRAAARPAAHRAGEAA